jgi:hypothetical protein
MLAAVVETWVLWLFIVGVAIGVVAALVVAVRLPRQEDDVSDLERPAEAAWISSVIERHGGIAPVSLVEEVLELHQGYLSDPRLARPPIEMPVLPASPGVSADPSFPAPGYPAPGYPLPPAAAPLGYTPGYPGQTTGHPPGHPGQAPAPVRQQPPR